MPPSLASSRPDDRAERHLAEPDHEHQAQQQAADDGHHPLTRMVSTTESDASTPTSITTKRNSIKMAPV